MHLSVAANLLAIFLAIGVAPRPTNAVCSDVELPINPADFNETDWEAVIEQAFPTWAEPEGGCPRLDGLGGTLVPGTETFPTAEEGKFNPCYYTKAFAGLDPSKGGYPTDIDTNYPYAFAAPFLKQPGDGSTHHCSYDAENIAACPKLGNTCGPDCATITPEYGIGHIPPFVPLAAVKNAYNTCEVDVCGAWFHYETSGCHIKKSVLDELVYQYFGKSDNGDHTINYQPPILIDGVPSNTYFRLEYGGESPACDAGNCRGPHYCSEDVAAAEVIWGDFCPYVHTGENSGKYRHPHIALAALELWIANKCLPDVCPMTWLDTPSGQNYAKAANTSTSITWAEMSGDNKDPIAQPSVPYVWPNSGSGIFPGHELYSGEPTKAAPGVYVTEFVELAAADTGSDSTSPSSAFMVQQGRVVGVATVLVVAFFAA